MNTDRLNTWLTLVANLAVVAGILFLAFEIRQNTLMQEWQMQMQRNAALNDPYFESPELAKVISKVKAVDGLESSVEAFMDRYDLTPEEAVLYTRYNFKVWYGQQAQFEFFGPSEELERSINALFQYPDVRIIYELNEDAEFTPEFQAYVESIVADGQP